MDFEWDAAKAEENFKKHKVSFSEAAEDFLLIRLGLSLR